MALEDGSEITWKQVTCSFCRKRMTWVENFAHACRRKVLWEQRCDWRSRVRQRCMRCLSSFKQLEVHEIERRSHAPSRYGAACNLLLLCGDCHVEVGAWSHARQLALKRRENPEDFDLERWLRLKDPELRAPERVTMAEVEAAQ